MQYNYRLFRRSSYKILKSWQTNKFYGYTDEKKEYINSNILLQLLLLRSLFKIKSAQSNFAGRMPFLAPIWRRLSTKLYCILNCVFNQATEVGSRGDHRPRYQLSERIRWPRRPKSPPIVPVYPVHSTERKKSEIKRERNGCREPAYLAGGGSRCEAPDNHGNGDSLSRQRRWRQQQQQPAVKDAQETEPVCELLADQLNDDCTTHRNRSPAQTTALYSCWLDHPRAAKITTNTPNHSNSYMVSAPSSE